MNNIICWKLKLLCNYLVAPLACHHSSHFENPCHQLWNLMRVWMKPSSKHFSTLNVFFFCFFQTVPFHFIWVNKHQTITNWGKRFFLSSSQKRKGGGPFGKLWHVVKPWDSIALKAGQSDSLLLLTWTLFTSCLLFLPQLDAALPRSLQRTD